MYCCVVWPERAVSSRASASFSAVSEPLAAGRSVISVRPWKARPSWYSSKLINHGSSSGESSDSWVMPMPPIPPWSSMPSGSSVPSGIPSPMPPPSSSERSEERVEFPFRRRPTSSIRTPSIVMSALRKFFSPSSW